MRLTRALHVHVVLIGVVAPLLFPAFTEDNPREASIDEILNDAGNASLLDRVLALNRVQEPELDLKALHTAFDALAKRAQEALANVQGPKEKIAALNKVLLGDSKVSYLSNKYWRDSTLAACLMRNKGNCLSTSTLYVLIGQKLHLPIRLVLIPRHAFVRWDDGDTKINIETTGHGREYSDGYYLFVHTRADPVDVYKLGWCRSVDEDGFYAELLRTAAMHRRSENKLDEADKLLAEAEKLSPDRADIKLEHIICTADLPGHRDESRSQIEAFLKEEDPPPTIAADALLFLADDAGAKGDFEKQRQLLLDAYDKAPKSGELAVLQNLAFCLRSMKDNHAALRYMELADTLVPKEGPERVHFLYNLAIMQKNDNRLDDALESLNKAKAMNPELWNLQVLEAGYRVLKGEREAGLALFEKIETPRNDVEFFECMRAWFYAVTRQREKFYSQFEHALSLAHTTHTLEWIAQDIDLDVYRNEPEFQKLVEELKQRVLSKATQK